MLRVVEESVDMKPTVFRIMEGEETVATLNVVNTPWRRLPLHGLGRWKVLDSLDNLVLEDTSGGVAIDLVARTAVMLPMYDASGIQLKAAEKEG